MQNRKRYVKMKNKNLKLMYITNNPEIASVALEAGTDIIFVDMEYIGKDERQGGLDSVKNHHTPDDIKKLRKTVDAYDGRQLLARVNPIHEHSETEINSAIESGADILMLPMWKSVAEVEKFIRFVNKKAMTILLLLLLFF